MSNLEQSLFASLQDAHRGWLDTLGGHIALLEKVGELTGLSDEIAEDIQAAREARAQTELLATALRARYAMEIL